MPEITKLPKWGQAEITRRDRRIHELENELAVVRAILEQRYDEALEPDWREKGAILDPYHHKVPIADGHVRYKFDDVNYIYIDTRLEHGCVQVHASRGLSIRPTASNSAQLYVRRD